MSEPSEVMMVFALTIEGLEDLVNRMFADGWRVNGGVEPGTGQAVDGSTVVGFVQAMVPDEAQGASGR
jgi:hypothetical protein